MTDRPLAAQVPGLDGVIAIATSSEANFSLALKRDGSVWAWGANENGQLGDGTRSDRTSPFRVAGVDNITAIAAGAAHILAVGSGGQVWTWGNNFAGQLGTGTTSGRLVPGTVPALVGVTAVAAGFAHSLALKGDGSVMSWGQNVTGAVGDGSTDNRRIPGTIASLSNVAVIAAGANHSVAVHRDGSMSAWGFNGWGQLALAEPITTRPLVVPSMSNVTQAAGGHYHTAALRSDGTVWTWGNDGFGQLGRGVEATRSAPLEVAGLPAIAFVAAGAYHSLAVSREGDVWAWGSNDDGQLGDGTGYARSVPTRVPGVSQITRVSAGPFHTLARRSDGTAWAWGSDATGALGVNGPAVPYFSPVQIASLRNVVDVAATSSHSLALLADGTVSAWGNNLAGELGDGAGGIRGFPAPVPGIADAIAVSAGYNYSLALLRDGTVWSWGYNGNGQLGDGTAITRLRPVRVTGIPPIAAISAGGRHTLAMAVDGSVWSWGSNEYGQLGGGAGPDRLAPRQVTGLTAVRGVAAGSLHSAALMPDGTLRTWGWNSDGELGDGTLADRTHPIVTLRERGLGSISGGDWFLDLDAAAPNRIGADETPPFKAIASGDVSTTLSARLEFQSGDVGTTSSVFVFALAPATLVHQNPASPPLKVGVARGQAGNTDVPIACVLAQLNSAGQMVAVNSANLAAYLTGVLTAQGASVQILNGVPTSNVSGATFFVGYGGSGTGMINAGTNRATVTIPGALTCQPSAPATGWWWNPAEDGRGFSLEKRGNNLFFASFLYDVSGRSTWYVSSGPVSLDGSLYNGDLLAASGGQTLGGPYVRFPTLTTVGTMTVTFNNESTGTLVWPGGTVPIQRFNIIQNGVTAQPVAGVPESGWWWNENESGRGFFMEWQGDTLDIAGYMYDDNGNSVWYLTVGAIGGMAAARSFTGTWWSYTGGQTLTGAWRQNTRSNSNVAPLTITFSGPDTALMTLPNGRTTNLRRHRF